MARVTIHIPKIHNCITCINSFIAHHKNDLEVNDHDGMFDFQIGPSD